MLKNLYSTHSLPNNNSLDIKNLKELSFSFYLVKNSLNYYD